MKKVKIGFWVILIVFVGLVIFQNQNFFFHSKHHLNINLLFDNYHTPDWNLGVFFLICFLAGLFISLFFAFLGKIKTNKLIKSLKQTINSQQAEMDTLRNEMVALKNTSTAEPKPVPEETQEEPIEQPQEEATEEEPQEKPVEEPTEFKEDEEPVENKETTDTSGAKTTT